MNTKPLQSTFLTRGSNVAAVEIRVETVAPAVLKPPARELRKVTRQHVKRIARSINDFGFLNPVIVDADMRIVAGVSRWKAAQLLELSSIPIIRVEHLSEPQLRLAPSCALALLVRNTAGSAKPARMKLRCTASRSTI